MSHYIRSSRVSMIKPCAKCGKIPNIKINVLNYCKNCFICSFETKAFRNITKVTPTSRIFVFLEDRFSSIVMHLLIKYFEDRRVSEVEVLCRSADVIPKQDIFSVSSKAFSTYSLQNFRGKHGLEFCINNQFDALIYAESLEDIACRSMELLCAGEGQKAAEHCSFESTTIINIFKGIRDKEITYYGHLMEIPRAGQLGESSQLRRTLRTFLSDIDSKNGLALFNIMSTFKKLG